MGILSGINPISGISKALFGEKGLEGGVMDILDKAGIVTTPEQKLAIKQQVIDYDVKIQQMDVDTMKEVNETMQAESKSEHVLQWAWRPLVGLCFVAVILNNYIVMPWFAQIKPITIPSEVWYDMMVVLGVAAATRGGDKNLLPDINFTKK